MHTIAAAVGTPFYCYSTATLVRHYRVFAAAFADMDAAKAFLDAEIGDLSSISNPETIQPIADLQKEKS